MEPWKWPFSLNSSFSKSNNPFELKLKYVWGFTWTTQQRPAELKDSSYSNRYVVPFFSQKGGAHIRNSSGANFLHLNPTLYSSFRVKKNWVSHFWCNAKSHWCGNCQFWHDAHQKVMGAEVDLKLFDENISKSFTHQNVIFHSFVPPIELYSVNHNLFILVPKSNQHHSVIYNWF